MRFYALQVRTRDVEKFLSIARQRTSEASPGAGPSAEPGAGLPRFLWPRRKLRIRRARAWHETLAPVFPGYLFVQVEEIDADLFHRLRTIPGFVRFLPSNETRSPLDQRDQETLMHFLSFGEIVDRSRVVFDENSRIRVLAGPLKGLEGHIVKVDRRKGRAKVRLQLYEDSFEIDFGFEALEAPIQKPSGEPAPSPTST